MSPPPCGPRPAPGRTRWPSSSRAAALGPAGRATAITPSANWTTRATAWPRPGSVGIGRGVRTVLMVPPEPRFLRPHVRPVQGRRGRASSSTPAWACKNLGACIARPHPRRSSASRRPTWPASCSAGARRLSAPASRSARACGWGGTPGTGAPLRPPRGGRPGSPTGRHAPRRDGRHPVHQRQHRRRQGRRLHARHLRRPGRDAPHALRHRARRGRPADVSAVRPVRPGAGHDGRHPRDGRDPARHASIRRRSSTRSAISASRTCSARRPSFAASADTATPTAIKLPTLRRVISAGAPVPAGRPSSASRHCSPDGVQVHTPYGATEALPVCSIGSDEILGETRHAHRPRAAASASAGPSRA